MQMPRLLLVLGAALTLAACTVNPRPVVVTTPAPQVVTTPAPVVTTPSPAVMGAGQAVTVEIPAGHFPPAGACRIWRPGVPAAQQEMPGSCADMQNRVPAGAILLRG